MKYIIYALVDPNTHQVRYVGRTRKTAAERLRGHMAPGKAQQSLPVYQWIRGLRPLEPILVVLQEIEDGNTSWTLGRCPVAAAETKWMKRFERSGLFNSIDRSSRTYRRLVNTQ